MPSPVTNLMTRLTRVGAVLVALTFSLGLFTVASAGPAAAAGGTCAAVASNYEKTAGITTSVPSAKPGDVVTVVGTGFPGEVEVVVLVDGVAVATVTTDLQGGFQTTFTVPENASGTITVQAQCDPLEVSAEVAVLGTTVSAADLPRTGNDPWPMTRLAVALVLVGGVLVFATRRRLVSQR
jgi:hypothetical protein